MRGERGKFLEEQASKNCPFLPILTRIIKVPFYNINLIRKQTGMQSQKAMVPQEKLRVHYFFIRGKCQPIRHLLYHLKVDFEDIMHEKSEEVEVEVGFNMGLPMLEDGDLRVHDAVAIMIYICKKYDNSALVGQTPQGMARVQEILMKYSTQRNKIFGAIIESLRVLSKNQKEATEAVLRKLLTDFKLIDFCLKSVIKSKKYILDHVTLADFVFYQICYYICGFYGQFIVGHLLYKYLLEFKKNFEKLQFFTKNKAKIQEKYLFLEFNNPKLNSQIQSAWKGVKDHLIKKEGNGN